MAHINSFTRLALLHSIRIYCVAILLTTVHVIRAQEVAPLFSGASINGNIEQNINLEEYRGKIVFIDFWASWCPPCLASLPAYDKMYRDLQHEDFEIIAINVDENPQNGVAFLQDYPVSYPVLADPEGNIGIPYRIRALPRAFLLDREGRIVKTYRSFIPGDEVTLRRDIEALLQ